MTIFAGRKRKLLLFLLIVILSLLLTGCTADQKAWQAAMEADTIESYQEYLAEYPEGKYAQEAMDALVWHTAAAENTVEGYKKYLDKYPEGKYVQEAKWQMAKAEDTVESFQGYLEKYPDGRYAREAKEEIFCLFAMTSIEQRTDSEIDRYYRELARIAPDELGDAISVLSSRWREYDGLTWEYLSLKVERPEAVNQAAEKIWDYIAKRRGYPVGVYLERPKLKITVEQDFGRAGGVSLPLNEFAAFLSECAGYEIVSENAESYDAAINIKVMGTPKGAYYTDGYYHWTGAAVEAEISFSAEGESFKWVYSDSSEPRYEIIDNGMRSPDDAPFHKFYFESQGFWRDVFNAFCDVNGDLFFYATLLNETNNYDDSNAIKLHPDRVMNMRNIAIGQLKEIGDPRVTGLLLDCMLTDEEPMSRKNAAYALGKFDAPDLAEPLINVLKSDPDPGVRTGAAVSLSKFDDSRIVELLISALRDSDMYRPEIALALGEIGDSRATSPLISLLTNDSSNICSAAAEALGEIGDPEAVAPLIRASKGGYITPNTTNNALVKIGKPALEPLGEALNNINEEIREIAIEALGKIGDPEAIDLLIPFVRSDNTNLSILNSAVRALGEIGDSRAEELFVLLLDHDSVLTRAYAIEALGKIGASGLVERIISLLVDDEVERIQISAARALGELGDPRAVEPLISALKGEGVRSSAIVALGQIGDQQAVEPLIGALKDESRSVRTAAVEALREIGDPRAVEPLISVLRDEEIRMTVIEALGKIGDPRATDPIIACLEDESAGIRIKAAEALGEIGDPRAKKALISTLKDKYQSVKDAAFAALEKLESVPDQQ